jgi:acetyltransferase-like isoleucine patch superfamily enzyme
MPVTDVSENGGQLIIGNDFTINSGRWYNRIGRQQVSMLIVGDNAVLKIGDNVGISGTAIICLRAITIGNNVKIGGNTVIYDSDFHSLEPAQRSRIPEDLSDVRTAPVVIGANAFIGAHTTILKGVTIGENSVVGAGSVVRGNIPPGEIWAGNPATFIRNVK